MSDETKQTDGQKDMFADLPAEPEWDEASKKAFPDLAAKYKSPHAALRAGLSASAEAQKLSRMIPKAPDDYPDDVFPAGISADQKTAMKAEFKAANMSLDQAKRAAGALAPVVKGAEAAMQTANKQLLMQALGTPDEATFNRETAVIRDWGKANLPPEEYTKLSADVRGVLAIQTRMLRAAQGQQTLDGAGSPAAPIAADVTAIDKELSELRKTSAYHTAAGQAKARALTEKKMRAQGKIK